ncbi:hypothetical protein PSHT_13594 [Puccinia striiformis]|uniref:Uncharacterized protein n=1 Tax=Puccinia striiformis TaxID=27350 RepID=A0A2S4UPR2_9BASI|nr:hypothetical protein PSHT_13594 [Puccinia striiformis]
MNLTTTCANSPNPLGPAPSSHTLTGTNSFHLRQCQVLSVRSYKPIAFLTRVPSHITVLTILRVGTSPKSPHSILVPICRPIS